MEEGGADSGSAEGNGGWGGGARMLPEIELPRFVGDALQVVTAPRTWYEDSCNDVLIRYTGEQVFTVVTAPRTGYPNSREGKALFTTYVYV
jgi:hypothetical protein